MKKNLYSLYLYLEQSLNNVRKYRKTKYFAKLSVWNKDINFFKRCTY